VNHDCHYHPGEAARWHCSECQVHYCSRCLPEADPGSRQALCPKCNKAMKYLGSGNEVVPFWQRLGSFFRYPFHAAPMTVIAICTFVPALMQSAVTSIVIGVLLSLALLKYNYAVISHTAEGHMSPPPLGMAFGGAGINTVVMQFLVIAAVIAIIMASGMFGGPIAMMLVMAFAVLAMPASIMILAMEQSAGPAINPINLASLIARIGTPYFLLYGYLILLMLASGAAQQFAFNHFPATISQPVSGFLSSTFTLILFHMLGYLLFQYQEELGFVAELQEDDNSPMHDMHHRDRTRRVDADIDMHLKDGHYDRVESILKEQLKRDAHNPVRLGQLYKLLMARRDVEQLYQYHPRLLAWLAERNDGEGIDELISSILEAEPTFRLEDPELAVRCANALYHRKRYKMVLRLLQDFHKRFPDSQEIAPAYLLVAKTLANGMEQWEKATAFLTFIRKRCLTHPLHEQVDTYLEQAREKQPLRGPRASFGIDDNTL
jgi:tetratricopeptide (TPR) repeat protein